MTERLRTLLRVEADDLLIPVPDAERIIRHGRRQRLRRPVGTGLAAAAAVVAVVVGTSVLTGTAQDRPVVTQTFAAASAEAAFTEYGAFSVGSAVYVGNHKVQFEHKIKSMYYTGEGVLVRMGKVAHLDSGESSKYVLIAPDGSTRGIPLKMGDRVPATDPASPYVTYAAPAEKGPLVERCFDGVMSLKTGKQERQCHKAHEPRSYHLVAVDLRTGEEAHRGTYDGKFTWGGWEAPPVSTHGDRMWALFDDGWVEYDWDSGRTRLLPHTQGMPLEAAGGRYADWDEPRHQSGVVEEGYDPMAGEPTAMRIFDFSTGEVTATVTSRSGTGFLSPVGRVVMDRDMFISSASDCEGVEPHADGDIDQSECVEIPADELPENEGKQTRLHDLATGKVVTLEGYDWGWTPEGDVIRVDQDADRLTRCDAATGTCEEIALEVPEGPIKVGGLSYES